MEIYKSRTRFISRKEVLVIMSVIIIPLLINKLLILYIFPGIVGFLIFAIGAIILFAFAYLKGIWSNSEVSIFHDNNGFEIKELNNNVQVKSHTALKVMGFGWIYEAFSDVITQEEDEYERQRKKLPVAQNNSNLMIVVQFKSENETIYLLESLSPWRSTPTQLPYFHLQQLEIQSICYHVKGLEGLISDLQKK